MSKKKPRSNPQKSQYGYGVSPEFKKHIEEKYDHAIDFGDAPDEMRLSDRILRLIDPYTESMDIILLVDCATIAWNECIHEDFGVKEPYSLNNMLINFPKYRELIDELKTRKRIMFPGNRKHIQEVKVYQKGDDFSVNVASSLDVRSAFMDMLSSAKDEPYETYSEADDDEFDANVESYEDNDDISKPNPHLKRTLLAVVDNQLRDNDPPITRETFERLQSAGYTAKESKEKIAAILIEDIYEVMTTKKPHNKIKYEKRLKELK